MVGRHRSTQPVPSPRPSTAQAVAIPAILYHAQKIAAGALMMELAAMAVLGGTVLAWQFFSENEGSSPFVY